MSKQTKDEVMEKLRGRYARAGQKHKTKLIDQAIDLFDYHRKAAIRALRHTPRAPQAPAFIGRPLKYEPAVLLPPLKVIWLASQQPCGKLLAAALPDWVPAYEAYHRKLPADVRQSLLEASPATLDRLLAPARMQHGRPRGGTRPGTLLRQQIPLRGGLWDENQAGYLEIDSVALCGGRLDGDLVWMLDTIDICTTWVEARAVWNRGQDHTLDQIKDIETRLPFALLGLDSDNGGFVPQLAPAPLVPAAGAAGEVHPQPALQKGRQRAHRTEKLDSHPAMVRLRAARQPGSGTAAQRADDWRVGPAGQPLPAGAQAQEQGEDRQPDPARLGRSADAV